MQILPIMFVIYSEHFIKSGISTYTVIILVF
jgi:hypothetical protein